MRDRKRSRKRRSGSGRGRGRTNLGRIVLCVFVEVIVICAMVIMVGWDKGVKEWFAQFEQPVLREVDITGINSPDAVLMQARAETRPA